MSIHDILWRNEGQVLTPELIVGIIHGAACQPADPLAAKLDGETTEYGGLVFHVELMADCLDELRELHRMQWEEVERVRDNLNPDYDGYLARERAGSYIQFTVRRDGELVGYAGAYLFRDAHTQILCAREDALFFRKDARKGRAAIKFFRYCEQQLRLLGAEQISITVKTSNDVYKIWEREGYVFAERGLTKVFDGGVE